MLVGSLYRQSSQERVREERKISKNVEDTIGKEMMDRCVKKDEFLKTFVFYNKYHINGWKRPRSFIIYPTISSRTKIYWNWCIISKKFTTITGSWRTSERKKMAISLVNGHLNIPSSFKGEVLPFSSSSGMKLCLYYHHVWKGEVGVNYLIQRWLHMLYHELEPHERLVSL